MRTLTACCGSALLLLSVIQTGMAQSRLEQGFQNPPAQARPHTWWHWMNGNITREGITADLEAMKHVGLGGAQIFNVSENIPDGPIVYNSPEWRSLVKFAASEAERLGLELCIHNCAGWSSSGGPWVTSENAMQMVTIGETTATGPSHFAAALAQPKTNHDFYRDIAVLAFPKAENDKPRIADIRAKALYEYKYGQQPAAGDFPADTIIKKDAILDLTAKLDKDGVLDWDVPAGNWTIMRIGHTPTGAVNAPAPATGRGLEVDKLSREAFDAYWAGGMGPLLKELGPLAGSSLKNCLIDSYEVGCQNWTPRFREEFTKRRGYDPIRFLPVMTGRVVESAEVSERFLWDLRRTVGDLFGENYYSYFAQTCRKNGLLASVEPYDGPFECEQVAGNADIVMGEFWVTGDAASTCKLAAGVAHTHGQKIIGSESFTAGPEAGKWMNHPGSLKAIGDLVYTLGINRYIIHRYAHQPWMNVSPGMTMGQWGTHFERTTTWWEQGAAWLAYLSRCQYMLQQGQFIADVCFFAGEASPNGAPFEPGLKAKGYDYDACGTDVILSWMSVEDGRIVLADGMSYRMLVLPETKHMTPKLLAKVRDLVREGATVIGPRPEFSPSAHDWRAADAEVAKLGSEIWGDCDGKAIKEHAYGKGRVIWGKTPEEVLAGMNIGPDCSFAPANGTKPKTAWIHRRVEDADVYFVSNQKPRSEEIECSFRVSGKAPAFWHADTGVIEPAPVWSEKDGRTIVPIRFDPTGSVFVVFRAGSAANHLVAVKPPASIEQERRAPKIQIIKAMYEAVDGSGGADVTAKVAAAVESGDTEIPASNGLFGDPTYNHVKRLRIDYTLDGKPLSRTVEENGTLTLADAGESGIPAAFRLCTTDKGTTELRAFHPGIYELTRADGKASTVDIKAVPGLVEIGGNGEKVGGWTVRFQSGRGAPESAKFDALTSWTQSADAGVKYFSGTAEYTKEFEIPVEAIGADKVQILDLGSVKEIAEVTLNGKNLGVWWKPPFEADVTGALKPGRNTLTVRVTNLWVNRLVGDEQFPDDCEWNGKPIRKWPDWFAPSSPAPLANRPVKDRLTFTTWKHWMKNSPLLDSGLLGPVRVRIGVRMAVE